MTERVWAAGTPRVMDRQCTRCGKKHLGTFVWLELNNVTGYYATPGTVPEGESQGLFPFGKTCSFRALGHENFEKFKAANPVFWDSDY